MTAVGRSHQPSQEEDYVKRIVISAAILLTMFAGPAQAQTTIVATSQDPNPGAITLTAGLDFPTIYFFRGIRQEQSPKLTMWPYGDRAGSVPRLRWRT